MNKIAHYLNTHMLGEVIVAPEVLAAYTTDASILHFTPDMVAYPRATSDIRKIARFSWQLADKGHTLPLTMRGAGDFAAAPLPLRVALLRTSAALASSTRASAARASAAGSRRSR